MMKAWLLPFILLTFLSGDLFAMRYSQSKYQRRSKEVQLREEIESFKASIFEVFPERKISVPIQRRLQRIIEKAIDRTGTNLGFKPTTKAKLMLLQGNTYDSIDDPNIATGGFYSNKTIRMRFNFEGKIESELKKFERVFRHEVTHLIVAAIDGGRTARWLNEGLAVYESMPRSERTPGQGRKFYETMQKKGSLIPIEDFVQKRLTWQYQSNPFFYDQSYVLAKYLVDRYGYAKLRELFKVMKSGTAFSHAFREVYGISYKALEQGAYAS